MKNLIRQNCLITTISRKIFPVKFILMSRMDFPVVIARRNYEKAQMISRLNAEDIATLQENLENATGVNLVWEQKF